MSRSIASIAILTAAAGSISDAHATTPAVMAESLRVAHAVIPGFSLLDGCANRRIVVHIVPTLTLADGTTATGLALNADCAIVIDDAVARASDVEFCAVLVHERIHLARQDAWHSSDPASVMHANYTGFFPPCDIALAPRVTLAETRRALRARLGGRWRLRCGREDLGAIACFARRQRFPEREYLVSRDRFAGLLTIRRVDPRWVGQGEGP